MAISENTRTIEGIDADESKLYEIKRNLFGLVIAYIAAISGLLGLAILLIFMGPELWPDASTRQVSSHVSTIVALCAVFVWLGLVLYTYIYRQSKLILTDKNLTQIIQRGLFNRSVSELSLADVEDVKAHQQGIAAAIFNFGNLQVQTAGAADNFDFAYCPRPNFYGKIILDARQHYIDTCHDTNSP